MLIMVRIIGFALLAYILVVAVRSYVFIKRTGILVSASDSFPREYSVGNPQDQPLRLLALGDSTVQGVGVNNVSQTLVYQVADKLSANGRYVQVTNYGISGAKVGDVVADQLPKIGQSYDIVMVSIGANDATHFTPKDQFIASVQKIVSTIATNQPTVLWASSPDMHYPPALPEPFRYFIGHRAQVENIWLQPLIDRPNFTYVDLYDGGRLDYSKDPTLYAPDLFHPSAKGYTVWAKNF
jgi:lysophospholipase L1-like esterase